MTNSGDCAVGDKVDARVSDQGTPVCHRPSEQRVERKTYSATHCLVAICYAQSVLRCVEMEKATGMLQGDVDVPTFLMPVMPGMQCGGDIRTCVTIAFETELL